MLKFSSSLISKLDKTRNWITPLKSGFIETRFVQRKPDTIIAYVSSHNGCRMKCKFCFLTQDKQFNFHHATIDDITRQFQHVVDYYQNLYEVQTATKVHVNFMARGEPLSNKYVVNNYKQLYDSLKTVADKSQLDMRINISTIVPKSLGKNLVQVFANQPVQIYYSLYSVSDTFRKLWLPNAKKVDEALQELKDLQDSNFNAKIAFHWALIENQNDSMEDVERVIAKLRQYGFSYNQFNLVRFNAHDNLDYKESEFLDVHFKKIREALGDHPRSKIVERVGVDVMGSCGMFMSSSELK